MKTPDLVGRAAVPVGPGEEQWRALSTVEREAFLVEVNAALSDPRSAMTEGRPHKRAKTRALDLLDLHFKAMGRVVYLAEEMAVVYPGEAVFSPDVLAVVDVLQPEDDPRMAWVVADESKGIDVALEVLHHGDRNKDLVENVARYARLGIPEYFVYDRARQQIHGYRLPDPGARRYVRILPQSGRFTSTVLGLDLAVQGGVLRFFQGMAELFGSADLIGRLTGIVGELEARADEAEQGREEARARAEEARATAEEAGTRANEAEARTAQALHGLRGAILALLTARGHVCSEAVRVRVLQEEDAATLNRWLLRATGADSAEEVFQ